MTVSDTPGPATDGTPPGGITPTPPSTAAGSGHGRAGRNLPAAIGLGVVLGAYVVLSLIFFKPAFVLFMGGPQRAPATYKDARELIEGSEGIAGMCVPVAPVMLTQRVIYHHSTAQGRAANESEPGGKAAEEVAALWAWIREHVNLSTRKLIRGKRSAA